jgi:hypothetical protein
MELYQVARCSGLCYKQTFRVRNKDSSKCTARDADKLERLLKARERQKEEAMYMEDIHKKVSYRGD